MESKENRLYVIVSKGLPTIGHKAAQAGHAVAKWIYDNNGKDTWKNEYLIILESKNLSSLKWKLNKQGIEYSEFKEPDFGYKTTAISVYKNREMFEKLNLLGS